jgi:hypothetical protein
MTTWMVDLVEKAGQRVIPDATWNPADRRFRKVEASFLSDALHLAARQVVAIEKTARVVAGETAIMGDQELDWLIDWDMHPGDVVSVPNPQRLGVLDAYLVGKCDHPTMRTYRAARGLPA